MEPLVSILVPAYNAQQWIADTLESALAQTWPKKEIIVVDDGSTDRTLQVAKQFASKTVRIITQANQGASVARNTAYSLCQGDYIQWLDADDLLDPDKIQRQMQAAEKCQRKLRLISCEWGYFMYRPKKARFLPTALWCDLSPLEWLLRKWESNLHMQTATWLVSRELTSAAGPWDTRLLVDNDGEYFFRVVRSSDGVQFVSGAKVFYRASGPNSVSYIGLSDKKMEAKLLGMKMQIGYLRQMEDSARVRAACVNHLQTWLRHFYPERPDLVEQAQHLARELGGKLETPSLRWKYAWMQPILGYRLAKRAQLLLPETKSSIARSWDKAMAQLETRAWAAFRE